jgi:hypothetical protein
MLLAPRLIPPQRFRRIQELLALEVQRQIDDNDAEMDRVEVELRNERREERARRPRNVWVRPWLRRRPEYGQYEKLMNELRNEDVAAFQNFLRVPPEMFRELEERLGPRLLRVGCNYRKPLEPGIMLAITMRHLATGDSYHNLMYGFRVAHNTISKVV